MHFIISVFVLVNDLNLMLCLPTKLEPTISINLGTAGQTRAGLGKGVSEASREQASLSSE